MSNHFWTNTLQTIKDKVEYSCNSDLAVSSTFFFQNHDARLLYYIKKEAYTILKLLNSFY